MQKAIDHLEKHKIYIDALHTDMIPLSEAYRAVELSINKQLEDTLSSISTHMETVFEDLSNLNQEND